MWCCHLQPSDVAILIASLHKNKRQNIFSLFTWWICNMNAVDLVNSVSLNPFLDLLLEKLIQKAKCANFGSL